MLKNLIIAFLAIGLTSPSVLAADIFGTTGDDSLLTGNGDDNVWAGDGNDIIRYLRGNDKMYGQNGDDYFTLGGFSGFQAKNNTIYGGNGVDTVRYWLNPGESPASIINLGEGDWIINFDAGGYLLVFDVEDICGSNVYGGFCIHR